MNATGSSTSPNTANCSSTTDVGRSPPATGTATGPATTVVDVIATVDVVAATVDAVVGAVVGAAGTLVADTTVVAGADNGEVDDSAVPQPAASTHTPMTSTRDFTTASNSIRRRRHGFEVRTTTVVTYDAKTNPIDHSNPAALSRSRPPPPAP